MSGGEEDVIVCDLNHDEATDDLVRGIDAIVNIGYEDHPHADADFTLDYFTRRVYNLLWAASQADVKRVVNVSTLRLMETYEENLVVTENWRSQPLASDVNLLCAHLCETVCKEFARDRKFQVVNLRLGWPIVGGSPDALGDDAGTAAVCHEDVGKAIIAALESDVEQWQDVHVQSSIADQRYSTAKASRLLGI